MKIPVPKRWLPLSVVAALVAIASVAILITGAAAQVGGQPVGKTYSYAAKFVCGLMPQDGVILDPQQAVSAFPRELPLKPANYATDINVHNPQVKGTILWKKAVLSGWVGTIANTVPPQVRTSEAEQVFPGGKYLVVQLPPDGAFSADCADIVKVLQPPGQPPFASFITGFVVINSPVQLDVTAVYTSERQDAPVVHCLLSDGSVVTATATATGPQCPTQVAGTNIHTVGMSVTQAGTGLTMDIVSVVPTLVAFPGHDGTGNNPN